MGRGGGSGRRGGTYGSRIAGERTAAGGDEIERIRRENERAGRRGTENRIATHRDRFR
jgi:hypothetical protein